METLTVTHEELSQTVGELALAEAQSAKRAAKLAAECAEEAAGLVADQELRNAWVELARNFAGVALGHQSRAVQYAPGSPAAREAREAANRATAFAESAAAAGERD